MSKTSMALMVVILAIVLVVIVFGIYWFGIRPDDIKNRCLKLSQSCSSTFTGLITIDGPVGEPIMGDRCITYDACLKEYGL